MKAGLNGFNSAHTFMASLLACSLLSFTSNLQANQAQATLKPFVAHYSSTWDVGLKLGGEATRQLQQTEDGLWQFSLNAKAMVARLNETSLLEQNQDHIQPLKYHYLRKILNNRTEFSVDFDWTNKQATTQFSDSWSMPIQPFLQDKLSVQLQLQNDLSQTKVINTGDTLSYEVAAGGQIEAFNYQIIAQEELSTPLGNVSAIKVERVRSKSSNRLTYIWFAPQLDYHVVKILQQEPDGKRYQLDLKQLTY